VREGFVVCSRGDVNEKGENVLERLLLAVDVAYDDDALVRVVF